MRGFFYGYLIETGFAIMGIKHEQYKKQWGGLYRY